MKTSSNRDSYYYTVQDCCDCPVAGTYYDGANCFVLDIAKTSIPFIDYGKGYLSSAGNDNYPYDQISGYEMEGFEQNILKQSFGLKIMIDKLKEILPDGMINRHIGVFSHIFLG